MSLLGDRTPRARRQTVSRPAGLDSLRDSLVGRVLREPQPWSDVVTDTVKTLVVPSIEDGLDASSFVVLGPQVTSRAGRRAAPGPRQRPWNGSSGGVPQRPFIRLSGRSNQPTAWSFQLCTSSVLCPLNKSLSGLQLRARHCIRRLGGA